MIYSGEKKAITRVERGSFVLHNTNKLRLFIVILLVSEKVSESDTKQGGFVMLANVHRILP